jgi:hypothetical protein
MAWGKPVMTEAGACIALLSLVLTVPIGQAVKTLLAMKERVIIPIMRVQKFASGTDAIIRSRAIDEAAAEERMAGYAIGAPSINAQSRRSI